MLERSGVAIHASETGREAVTGSASRAFKAPSFLIPYHLIGSVAFAIDLILIVGTSVLAGLGSSLALGNTPNVSSFLGTGVLAFSNFSAVLAARGDYRKLNLANFARQARGGTLAWVGVFLILLTVAFLLKASSDLSRGATIAFFTCGLASFLAWRFLLARSIAKALASGVFAKRKIILIAQKNRLASSRVLPELERCGYLRTRTFELTDHDVAAPGVPWTVRRMLQEVVQLAQRDNAQDIFLSIEWQYSHCIEEILDYLKVLPIPIHLLPDETASYYLSRPSMPLGSTWAAELKRAPLKRPEQLLKRSLDVIGASAGIVVLSPLMLLTALLIKLDSRGPILFTQARNGFNGRAFRIFKFRTMSVLEDGPSIRQATKDDPRVTRLGRILRQTSIDELPQLFNVLRGDMSIVGPRPHAIAHDAEYGQAIARYAFRHHVKPGITGWAQVNGCRGETQTLDMMIKRVELDIWYINNWSICLDLKILLKTLVEVLCRRSAY